MPTRPSLRRLPNQLLPRGSRIGAGATALLSGAFGLGALAVVNRLIESRAHETFSVLSGESRRYPWTEGDIFYKVKGQGEPLVLVHGIYAGASAFEWRRNFDALAAHFRVYAPDLLGYGLSSRPRLDYTSQTAIHLLLDFIREAAGGAERPVHVIASGLSAAHIIQAAFQRPKLFERLVLIEPTGIYERHRPPTLSQRALHILLCAPVIGTSIYHAIVSRPALRYYLARYVYLRPEAVTDDLVDYYYNSALRPGGRFATISFLGGHLNLNVEEAFARLTQPTLIVWGKQARITPVEDTLTFRHLNPRAQIEIIDGSGMLPQEEQADHFNQRVIEWLAQPAAARA